MANDSRRLTLEATHKVLKRRIEKLSFETEIPIAELKIIHSQSYALIEEMRLGNYPMADEYRSFYSGALTNLRLRARSKVLQDARDLYSLSEFIHPNDEIQRYISSRSSQKNPGVSEWEKTIGTGIIENVRKLIGTYVSAEEISRIGGYSRLRFDSRIKGANIQKKDNVYLVDENSAVIFFGNPSSKSSDSSLIVNIPPQGIPLEDIERLAIIRALEMSNGVQKGAADILSISPRVMNYKIKTLKLNLQGGDQDLSDTPPDGDANVDTNDVIDYTAVVEIAKPYFGEKTYDEVARIIESSDKIEAEDGKFSRKAFERALKRYK